MDSIQIQCPECQQLFSSESSFMGKKVECGACASQFRVTEENSTPEKTRVYPGEKQKVGHRNFRAAGNISEQSISFQKAHYDPNARAEDVFPLRPVRKMAIGIGFALLLVFALIFTLGNSAISDVPTTSRYLLALVISVISFFLILYGARRKFLTLLPALALMAVLCSAPIFFKYQPPPTRNTANTPDIEPSPVPESLLSAPAINLENLGYDKVRKAMSEEGASEESVVAYAFYGYTDSNQDLFTRYLYDAYGQRDYPSFYKERYIGEEEVTLVVMRRVTLDSLTDAANLARPFGDIKKIHRDLRVIEVRVDQEKIQGDPESHYMSETSSEFYDANFRELSHVDRERRINALTRLTSTTSLQKRVDFVRKLVSMLEEGYSEKETSLIIQALNHWSQPEDRIQEDVFTAIDSLLSASGNINTETMAYLMEQDVPGRAPILSRVWAANPVQWQAALVATGELGKQAVLLQLPELNPAQMNSAARIMQELGTKEDAVLLKTCLKSGDENSQKAMKATIDELESRQ